MLITSTYSCVLLELTEELCCSWGPEHSPGEQQALPGVLITSLGRALTASAGTLKQHFPLDTAFRQRLSSGKAGAKTPARGSHPREQRVQLPPQAPADVC